MTEINKDQLIAAALRVAHAWRDNAVSSPTKTVNALIEPMADLGRVLAGNPSTDPATVLLRSLVSDIESMRNAKLDADGEVFFGPFSVSDCPGADIPFSLNGDNVSVSWPNLAITMQQAKEFLK